MRRATTVRRTSARRAWRRRGPACGPTACPPTLRAQFSCDLQQSYANSDAPKIKIYGLVDGIGRSNILPRQTREHKLHMADTVSYNTGPMNWKFGGDLLQTWIYNYYPAMYGGEFYFDNVKVNPWFFTPQKNGDPLTPLRAYAHGVPRYYAQDFGDAVSHPNSRSYSAFVQDTIRITRSLTLNVGVRYDLQTFEVPGLVSNPEYAPLGMTPTHANNFSRGGIHLCLPRAPSHRVARRLRPLL
jgi:outer membrane receptor protein involved in Fe transport